MVMAHNEKKHLLGNNAVFIIFSLLIYTLQYMQHQICVLFLFSLLGCRRILDDLSQTADALKTTVASDPLVSAAATVQAQVQAQQALLQQASLSNPGLLPLLQGLQQNSTSNASTNNATDATLASQLAAAAMMLPGGQFNPQTVSSP